MLVRSHCSERQQKGGEIIFTFRKEAEQKQTSATHLGGQLRADGFAKPEVEGGRISKAATAFRKLTPLWTDTSCSELWKLWVSSAVVFAALMYGLEAVPCTQGLERRVNYFQAQCYRNILKIQAAYYSRVSNKKVLAYVSTKLHDHLGRTPSMSRQIADRAVILGHVIRSSKDDHMRNVAIDAEFKRMERSRRRVGRPCFHWLQNTVGRAFKLMRKRQGLEKQDFNIRD